MIASILNKVDNIINKAVSMFTVNNNTDIELTVSIGKNIYYRTQLICQYIQEHGHDFEVQDFIMLLYLNYIKEYIESNDTRKAMQFLDLDRCDDSEIIIDFGAGNEKFIVKNDYKYVVLDMSIGPQDAHKGNLIVDELNYLYDMNITLGDLIGRIWTGFILNYNTDNIKRLYAIIIRYLNKIERAE